MSSIKGKNTKPEIVLRKELWAEGIKGYRLHYKKAPGRPDICFVNKKIAVFVNGCYWHRCPHCDLPLPQSNTSFWKEKFNKNIERDNRKMMELDRQGWKAIVIWECQIKDDLSRCCRIVKNEILGK